MHCAAAHAGLVPGIICLVSVPLILYVIYPPEVKDTPDAPAKARRGSPLTSHIPAVADRLSVLCGRCRLTLALGKGGCAEHCLLMSYQG